MDRPAKACQVRAAEAWQEAARHAGKPQDGRCHSIANWKDRGPPGAARRFACCPFCAHADHPLEIPAD